MIQTVLKITVGEVVDAFTDKFFNKKTSSVETEEAALTKLIHGVLNTLESKLAKA